MSKAIDSARRLALRLHALHGDDRAWILSQLPVAAKARLEPLLEELNDLGFSIDQEMVDTLDIQDGDASLSAAGVGEHERHIAALERAPAEWIVAQLKDEPPALLDCLLSAHAWCWSQDAKPSGIHGEPSLWRSEPRLAATSKVGQWLVREMARRIPAEFPQPALTLPREAKEAPATVVARGVERIRALIRSRLPWKR